MPTLPLPLLILIALVLVIAARVLQRVGKLFLLIEAVRAAFKDVGIKALGKVPDRVKLERLTAAPRWKDPAAMEAMARPLLALAFSDCGAYAVDPMPAVKIWILLKEDAGVSAFLYEHPKAAPWIEFSVRCQYMEAAEGRDLYSTYKRIIRTFVGMMNHPETWILRPRA